MRQSEWRCLSVAVAASWRWRPDVQRSRGNGQCCQHPAPATGQRNKCNYRVVLAREGRHGEILGRFFILILIRNAKCKHIQLNPTPFWRCRYKPWNLVIGIIRSIAGRDEKQCETANLWGYLKSNSKLRQAREASGEVGVTALPQTNKRASGKETTSQSRTTSHWTRCSKSTKQNGPRLRLAPSPATGFGSQSDGTRKSRLLDKSCCVMNYNRTLPACHCADEEFG